MKDLKETGEYKLDSSELSKIREIFDAGTTDDKVTLETIKRVYENEKYLMDTHTAVAWDVYEKWVKESGNKDKTVVLSTASAYKFSSSVLDAIGEKYDDEFDALTKLEKLSGVKVPSSLDGIKEKKVVHKNVLNKEDMLSFVTEMVSKKTW
jgi:threonine synthase